MAPHKSERSCKPAELKERARVRHENDCILWLQDPQHSWGYAEETGKESSMTTPILALQEALCGSLKRHIPAAQLAALRKRMAGYRKEECLRKLQEEQELLDAPANAECNTKTTGKCSTRTAQDSTDAGAPPVAVVAAPPPPQASDNGQQLGPSNANPTELEITLANPNLHPEDREFAGSARFKNPKKMVLGNATTARYVPSLSRG
jgi:hypothetical protein